MYKLNLFFLAFLFISIAGHGQAGIGATPSTVAGIGPGKFEVTGVGDFTIKVILDLVYNHSGNLVVIIQ
jgi:hypothetical protein